MKYTSEQIKQLVQLAQHGCVSVIMEHCGECKFRKMCEHLEKTEGDSSLKVAAKNAIRRILANEVHD